MATPRVTKLDLSGYSQNLALTQEMINAGLEGRWLIDQENAKEQNIDLSHTVNSMYGSFEKVLYGPMKVIVSAKNASYSTIFYQTTFMSGTANLHTDASEGDLTPYDVTGWYIAFGCDLSLASFRGTPSEEKALRDKINVPGVYSLEQLQIAIGTVNPTVYNDDLTCKQILDLPPDAQIGFVQLVLRIQKDMDKNNKLTPIALSVKQESQQLTSSATPTFLPTYQRFQTSPWLKDWSNPAADGVTGLTGNSRLNYLCFTEMVDWKPPPTPTVLKRWGNWTDGQAPSGPVPLASLGTFAMSADCFLEGWLFKKLQVFNKITECSMDWLRAAVWMEDGYLHNVWDCNMKVGDNPKYPDASAPYFAFSPHTSDTAPPEADRVYQWQNNVAELRDKNTSGGSAAFGTCWANANCGNTTTLSFTPGSNVININGVSTFHLYSSLKKAANPSKDDTLDGKCTWGLKVTITSVLDGSLQIDIDESVKPDYSITRDDKGQGAFKDWRTYLQAAFTNGLANLSEYRANLVTELAASNRFVLPAGGTFFYKDPMLSTNGALLSNIFYNASDKTEDILNPNKGAPKRVEVAATSPEDQGIPPSAWTYSEKV